VCEAQAFPPVCALLRRRWRGIRPGQERQGHWGAAEDGQSMSDEIERTTPLGFFNYARSYWRSAEYLHAAKLKPTHPSAPVTFLFCHAIESYLKAFLLSQKLPLKSLKSVVTASIRPHPKQSGLTLF
jgi:hypothetical protein